MKLHFVASMDEVLKIALEREIDGAAHSARDPAAAIVPAAPKKTVAH